jgi:23S rRNA pseudouridine2605 synthase
MHPKHEIPKSYQVSVDKTVDRAHLDQLVKGVRLYDGKTAPAEVYVIPGGKGKEIGIIIHEGRNRQVRRMFEHFGYEVKKLERVAYGPVTKEGLARGGVRSLTKQEVRKLREMAGAPEELFK